MIDSRIRARFIHKILKEEGDDFLKRQGEQIQRKTQCHTGRLLEDRRIYVYSSVGDFSAKMEFTHPIEERFLDISKRRYIHNRPIMKTYNRIAERMMTEFTDALQEQLRGEIEDIRKRFLQGQ